MKYFPKYKEELKKLCDDDSIYLGDIDTSQIVDMSNLFENSFREDFSGIENWDVSHVENMSFMFDCARYFNHPISNWDVSHVENMSFMFAGARAFNQPLDNWDVSNIVNMGHMFENAVSFKQELPLYWPVNLSDVAIRMSRENYDLMRVAFDELKTGNTQSHLALKMQALLNTDSANNMDYFFRDVNYFLEQIVQIDETYVDFMFENVRWDENSPAVVFFKVAMKNTDDYDFLRIGENTDDRESKFNTASCPFYETVDGIMFEYKDEQMKPAHEIDCKNAEAVFSSIISVFDKAGVKREDLKKAFNAALQNSKKDVLT